MLMTPIRLGSNVYTLKEILRLSTVGLCGFVFIIFEDLMCQKRSSRTVREIRRQLVPPNPSLRYNLTQPERRDFSQYQEMGAFVQKIFGDKRSGVFLEAGAFDGERYSNSLQVERERGWTGLLIEPLEDNFAKLRSKNRHATLLNACVDSVRGRKVKVLTGPGEYATSHEAEMVENRNPFVFHKADALVKHSVVCYNIQDILEAASLRHIDWLILDLEGGEKKVLQSFPWHTVSVDVVQIECCFNVRTAVEDEELETWYRHFLASKGYGQVFRSRLDLMFRRRA